VGTYGVQAPPARSVRVEPRRRPDSTRLYGYGMLPQHPARPARQPGAPPAPGDVRTGAARVGPQVLGACLGPAPPDYWRPPLLTAEKGKQILRRRLDCERPRTRRAPLHVPSWIWRRVLISRKDGPVATTGKTELAGHRRLLVQGQFREISLLLRGKGL
jgi:hypothetical protein